MSPIPFVRRLAAAALCLGLALSPLAATAADQPQPIPGEKSGSKPIPGEKFGKGSDSTNTTVGITTATRNGPDDRNKFAFELAPRQTRQDFVEVSNYSNHPVAVRLLAKDATTSPGVEYDVQPSSQAPTDTGSWIGISKPNLTIPARQRIVVPIVFGVPYNASPGDHAGAVILSLLANEVHKKSEIVVEHRIGVRVNIRVPGSLSPHLQVRKLRTTFTGPFRWFGVGRSRMTYDVVNTGNVTLTGSQAARFARLWGLVPGRGAKTPELGTLLPGGRISVDTSRLMLVAGPLESNVEVVPKSPAEGVKAIGDSAWESIFVVPWAWLLIIALVILWRVFRKRINKALAPYGDRFKPMLGKSGSSVPTTGAKRRKVKRRGARRAAKPDNAGPDQSSGLSGAPAEGSGQ